MRIAIAQLNYHIGNFDANFQRMESAVQKARQSGADLICFSELAVCGYPPRDFLEFKDFIRKSMEVVNRLCALSQDIAIVVGAPTVNPEIEGKDLFNSAFVLYNCKVLHLAHKALLPNYDIFDEYRYFEPCRSFKTFELKGKRIAITICEDIWNLGNENPMYTICPMDEMIGEKPDFMLNLSASPFDHRHAADRLTVIRANVMRYGIPMFYVNCVGGQTDVLFDGGSVVFGADGRCHEELAFFEEAFAVYDLCEVSGEQGRGALPRDETRHICDALVMGIRDYFKKMGFDKAILGLSGGIDSALTAALACEALGADHVFGLMMPSPYSSRASVDDAVALADALGMKYACIPIESVFGTCNETLRPHFGNLPPDVTEENLQARIRGMLLMAFSNKYAYILLNTTNKSEMAVGYGTLYGDLCGGLAVLADVYKTQVYRLAAHINREREIIPRSSIEKPPSAELRPNQKDTDSLPPYELLDPVLQHYIEQRKGPSEIIAMGYDPEQVRRILRMVNRAEFKRFQAPPVLRVSPKSFGLGRRMPIEGKYLC
ncbi:MAG: NAD+ synthase [Saprospiraceae bacterium]|jgi:NAD+ synthase (glutamine-hydrolysing)|nr:NAD+ synthase [Saprospiraceae bacterium]MBP9209780.1 NAD+ synthase [Saprospiraceae bacterium]MBV6473336.1 Glutamine-dependent NAD(+) synthetase [Saprospiraceae bacterium]